MSALRHAERLDVIRSRVSGLRGHLRPDRRQPLIGDRVDPFDAGLRFFQAMARFEAAPDRLLERQRQRRCRWRLPHLRLGGRRDGRRQPTHPTTLAS